MPYIFYNYLDEIASFDLHQWVFCKIHMWIVCLQQKYFSKHFLFLQKMLKNCSLNIKASQSTFSDLINWWCAMLNQPRYCLFYIISIGLYYYLIFPFSIRGNSHTMSPLAIIFFGVFFHYLHEHCLVKLGRSQVKYLKIYGIFLMYYWPL